MLPTRKETEEWIIVNKVEEKIVNMNDKLIKFIEGIVDRTKPKQIDIISYAIMIFNTITTSFNLSK